MDKYESAAWALADVIELACKEAESGRVYEHCYENSLDAVPDMMARLGIMKSCPMGHEFAEKVSVSERTGIRRHPGEPTFDDLGFGIDFFLAWFGAPRPVSSTVGPRHNLLNLAVELNRGIVVDGNYIPSSDMGVAAIKSYYGSRAATINVLGNEDKLYPSIEFAPLAE
ncbi:hypothetical protein [Pontixanthobacter sp. CEM42]|uniref:hypothetical protein n=1 Tax=Pontixanthobacter sp. CEM42 TaxID=2792077 RepID=UPI001AE0CEF6|nr:hypothetical protein [Pontixanthobacter sp. CEM42]